MINWDQFHFLRPYWLLALLPLLVILWLMLTRKLGNRSWENICDASLLPYILIGTQGGIRRTSITLTTLCGLLAIISLAGPVWNKLPQPVYSSRTALVIALDLSRSMDATDISPSRLARARFKIADILNMRKEGQIALLVYAGDAFTVTPLTDDTQTIISQLSALTTSLMPVAGNRTDRALSLAANLLEQAGMGRGDILLITDEVDMSRSQKLAESLGGRGYRVSIMGVGSRQGVPVPLEDGSFLKDHNGQIIIPELDEAAMRSLTAKGGGRYVRLTIDDSDITELDRYFSVNFNNTDAESTELQTDVWQEQGPWLLILLLPMAAMVFRKGYLVVLIVVCFPYPRDVHAFDWESLWIRSEQRAQKALDEGNADLAAQLFEDPAWKGAAKYRSGDYSGAIKSLEKLDDTENQYNLGNALARQGQLETAIATYESVLKQKPDHEDAKYNKELLEKVLEDQQKKQQSQPDQGKRGSNQQQDGNDQQGKTADNKQPQPGQENQMGREQQSGENANDRGQDPIQQQEKEQQQAGQSNDSSPREQNQDQAEDTDNLPGTQPGDKQGKEKIVTAQDNVQPDEEQQATEQWLRRIPDDPAGLLRRKFLYQYQQRQANQDPGEKTW